MTSYEKFSHNLTLETQIDWEISAFCYYRWMQQNAKKWLNFQNFQLNRKIVKHFARPKQPVVLRKLFSLPQPTIPLSPRQNLPASLEQKFSSGDMPKYTGICFQISSRMRFFDVKKWCSANVIFGTKQNPFLLENL